MGVIIALIIVTLLVGPPIVFANGGVMDFFYNNVGFLTRISRAQYLRYDNILSQHSTYYAQLSRRGKARYLHRLVVLVRRKEWVGRGGLEITEEMRVLTSGAAVQLTYGLTKFSFSNITTIMLYPDVFRLPMAKNHMRGGTSPRGKIMLSWKHLVHGFETEADRINLGLHELAHALQLEIRHGLNPDMHFVNNLDRWLKAGTPEFKRLKAGKPSFLRKYGGSNQYEFFAVCVEHFFEAPQDFAAQLPKLYTGLVVLLKQDPRNARHDYAVVRRVRKPTA